MKTPDFTERQSRALTSRRFLFINTTRGTAWTGNEKDVTEVMSRWPHEAQLFISNAAQADSIAFALPYPDLGAPGPAPFTLEIVALGFTWPRPDVPVAPDAPTNPGA